MKHYIKITNKVTEEKAVKKFKEMGGEIYKSGIDVFSYSKNILILNEDNDIYYTYFLEESLKEDGYTEITLEENHIADKGEKMKEHEKLKEICENIGYDIESKDYMFLNTAKVFINIIKIQGKSHIIGGELKEKEIIFTQEFMDKFENYINGIIDLEYKEEAKEKLYASILSNLDNPVDYLYDLIK